MVQNWTEASKYRISIYHNNFFFIGINSNSIHIFRYSLIIIDNPNLQELFTFGRSDTNLKQLNILEGKIFVHLNPKLCPHRIENLKAYANVADWDERDVSIHTNGDKEACNTQKLIVETIKISSKRAFLRFDNFAKKLDDPRSLLYYLVNYRVVNDNGTVTMFDGRDGCNSQNDVWTTIEEPPIYKSSELFQEIDIKVEPATRYALYVKTFTIFAGSTGALSDIIYFTTAPDTPGIPKDIDGLSRDSSSISITWSPPSKPNGIIQRYLVTVTKIAEVEDFMNMDICASANSIANRDKITKTLTQDEPKKSALMVPKSQQPQSVNDNSIASMASCKATTDKDLDIQVEVVAFQDRIIDMVYIKNPCHPLANNSSRPSRKRRSSEVDDNNLSYNTSPTTFIPNSLPVSSSIETATSKSSMISPTSTPTTSKLNQISTQTYILFDSKRNKTERNITVNSQLFTNNKMTAIVVGLKHYSLYTIEIVACHGEFISDGKTITNREYDKCGMQAITQVRTDAIPENDRVLKLHKNTTNTTSSSSNIEWEDPKDPNGLILAYRYRYKLKDDGQGDVWTEGCLNSSTIRNQVKRGISSISIPLNILPGDYIIKVQAVSLYSGSAELWTDDTFTVYSDSLSSITWALIISSGIVTMVVVAAVFALHYQKQKHDLTNGLIYASVNPDYIQYDPDEWEVDKSNLIIGAQIGTGSFGMVFKGQLKSEKGALSCAIKTVPPTSTLKQRMDFLREASIMKQFDTYHVVKLMGVISTTTPVYVIMEFMENGDLKSYLRGLRDVYQKEKKLLVDGIYLMAAQIADGMAYLASKKFVHRDLAARNCMVGENGIVKIGDFGLTRDIYANDYYRRDTQGRLPVRWMAPESLKDNIYDSASDVWSYGIVVWEIVTFSAYPYQGLSNDEVIKRVISGFTLSRPDNCSDKLFHIMERCWKKSSRDRPTFNDIVEFLLPEIENQLYPNCFYRKQKTDKDSIATVLPQRPPQKQSEEPQKQPDEGITIPEENNTGTESYPLLAWPSHRPNGLTNGVNHHIDAEKKKALLP